MRFLVALLILMLILTVGCGRGYHSPAIDSSPDQTVVVDDPVDDDEPISDGDVVVAGDECYIKHKRLCCPVLNRNNEVKVKCSREDI